MPLLESFPSDFGIKNKRIRHTTTYFSPLHIHIASSLFSSNRAKTDGLRRSSEKRHRITLELVLKGLWKENIEHIQNAQFFSQIRRPSGRVRGRRGIRRHMRLEFPATPVVYMPLLPWVPPSRTEFHWGAWHRPPAPPPRLKLSAQRRTTLDNKGYARFYHVVCSLWWLKRKGYCDAAACTCSVGVTHRDSHARYRGCLKQKKITRTLMNIKVCRKQIFKSWDSGATHYVVGVPTDSAAVNLEVARWLSSAKIGWVQWSVQLIVKDSYKLQSILPGSFVLEIVFRCINECRTSK